jgi:hypothetical protein
LIMTKLISCFALSMCALLASFSAKAESPILGVVDSDSSAATLYAPFDIPPPRLIQAVDSVAGSACCFRVDAKGERSSSIPVTDDLLPSQTFRAYALRWIGPGPKPPPTVAAALPKEAVVQQGTDGRYTIRYGNDTYGLAMCTTSEGLRTTLTPLGKDTHSQRAPEPKAIVSWYYYLGYDTEATCQ